MKNVTVFLLLITTFFVVTVEAAQINTPLSVSTIVGASCSVSTSPVLFTNYDGSADVTSQTEVTVQCTSGLNYSVAIDAGASYNLDPVYPEYRALSDGAGGYLGYGIETPDETNEWSDVGFGDTYPWGEAVTGTGTGADQVLTSSAFLLANPGATGTYSDTVNVTVHF